MGIIGAVLLVLGPPALAVYLPIVDRVECRTTWLRVSRVMACVAGVLLAYGWLIGTLIVMAHLAPLYRDAGHPFLQGLAICYPLALLLAALWWLALAMVFRLFLAMRAGLAIDLALTCMKWCLIVTPLSALLWLPH